MQTTKSSHDEGEIVSDINMTPLIDIMLVLLIIFMVSSSAAIENGLDVLLPEAASGAAAGKEGQALVISLNKKGDLLVSGKRASMAELKAVITEQLKTQKTDAILFEGDAESQLASAVEIMDIATQAGARNFAIATRAKD